MVNEGLQQDVTPLDGGESVTKDIATLPRPIYAVQPEMHGTEEKPPRKGTHVENADSKADGEKIPQAQGNSSTSDFEYQDADLPFEIDPHEVDSEFDNIPASSTASLSSSLHEPIREYGRSYHRYRSGKYMLPNDETEQARLDLQHNMFLVSLRGELHLAPIRKEDLRNVLDLATGTGRWAIDFAVKYPSANVIGTDLSPIQPQYLPPNCSFEVADAEDDWHYPHPFDYIHGRMLVSCFQSFPAIVSKVFTALRPGGYFELQDICPMACLDDSWDNTALRRWNDLIVRAAAVLGMDWQKATKYKRYLEEAGFEDVRELQLAWATNTWPRGRHHKLLGAWNSKNYLEGFEGFTMRVLHKGMGMEVLEIEELLKGARECVCDRRIHAYTPVRIIYGRKPLKL